MAVYSNARSLISGTSMTRNACATDLWLVEATFEEDFNRAFIEAGVLTEAEEEKKEGKGIIGRLKEFLHNIVDAVKKLFSKAVEKGKEMLDSDANLYKEYHEKVEKVDSFDWKHKYTNLNSYSDIRAALDKTTQGTDYSTKARQAADELNNLSEKGDDLTKAIDEKVKAFKEANPLGTSDEKEKEEESKKQLGYQGEEEKTLHLEKGDIASLNSAMKVGQSKEMKWIEGQLKNTEAFLQDLLNAYERAGDYDSANEDKDNSGRAEAIAKGRMSIVNHAQSLLSEQISKATQTVTSAYAINKAIYKAIGGGSSEKKEEKSEEKTEKTGESAMYYESDIDLIFGW